MSGAFRNCDRQGLPPYRFSFEDDRKIGEIWIFIPAIDGGEREVRDGPPAGGEVPDLDASPPLYEPSVNAEGKAENARRL